MCKKQEKTETPKEKPEKKRPDLDTFETLDTLTEEELMWRMWGDQ